MIDSFYIGATGMDAQQVYIDTIANNVSNINTTAFKKARVSFEDMFYRRIDAAAPLGFGTGMNQVGLGTAVGKTDVVFTDGNLVQTGGSLDIAIKGNGFIEVSDPSGAHYYTRLGALQLDSNGDLQTRSGLNLVSKIRIPSDATQVTIGQDGTVTAQLSDQSQPVQLGQLELANFVNVGGLRPLGDGLFASTDVSGPAFYATPGQDGTGTISQGYLESSNVDLNSELLNLVEAQRAYQLNSRVVQISDDVLNTIVNLRR
jgi:flagellar basal-body rod protein FlgG